MLLRLAAILRELDAAGLAAAADLHLRLDHHRVAELLGGLHRLRDRRRVAGPPGQARRASGTAACPGIRGDPSRVGTIRRRAQAALEPYRKTMALPKEVQFVTFDCYGTLIDWEAGVYEAFQKEADRDGFTIDRDALVPRFIEVQREIQRGSYELYAEVLRRTAVRVAKELGWELEPSRSNFLPEQRAAPGRRSARPTRSSSASPRSTRSGSSRTSTTSSSAPPGATSAPTSTWWSPPSRCAATSPTRRTSRSARGGSRARRGTGSTSPRATRPTWSPASS